MNCRTMIFISYVLMLVLMLSAYTSCIKAKVGDAANDAGENNLNKSVPGSGDEVPLLDDDGKPVFNENGKQVFTYKTTIVQDISSLIFGGSSTQTIFTYILGLLMVFVGRYFGVSTTTKKFGNIMDVKDDALDLITKKINGMAGASKYAGAFKWITGQIQSSASKHTEVGSVIHTSAKKSEHKRNGAAATATE